MSDSLNRPGSDYSPDISIELLIHGERFSVASLGPGFMIVRQSRPVPPGPGTVTLTVNKRVTIFHITLSAGIDPSQRRQSYQLLSTVEEAAA